MGVKEGPEWADSGFADQLRKFIPCLECDLEETTKMGVGGQGTESGVTDGAEEAGSEGHHKK